MKNTSSRPTRKVLLNVGFIVICSLLLLFLYLAPEESTSPLPQDAVHEEFHRIESKKEADKLCAACHGEDKDLPLPEDHPPPYRCLFCHKRSS